MPVVCSEPAYAPNLLYVCLDVLNQSARVLVAERQGQRDVVLHLSEELDGAGILVVIHQNPRLFLPQILFKRLVSEMNLPDRDSHAIWRVGFQNPHLNKWDCPWNPVLHGAANTFDGRAIPSKIVFNKNPRYVSIGSCEVLIELVWISTATLVSEEVAYRRECGFIFALLLKFLESLLDEVSYHLLSLNLGKCHRLNALIFENQLSLYELRKEEVFMLRPRR